MPAILNWSFPARTGPRNARQVTRPVDVLSAEHGNDPEEVAAIARDWYRSSVGAVFDLASSGSAIAA